MPKWRPQITMTQLLLLTAAFAAAFGLLRFARSNCNLWLLVFSVPTLGWAALSPLVLSRKWRALHPLLCSSTWLLVAGAFIGPALWFQTLDAVSPMSIFYAAEVVERTTFVVVLPVTVVVVLYGITEWHFTRRTAALVWSALGCVPLVGVLAMQITGFIRW